MICKYCGKPVSGGICSSCKKAVSLSYTSHELSDMLGLGVVSPSPAVEQEKLRVAYEKGFSSGNKHGYSLGWDAAQKDASETNKRKQRLLTFIAASAMVLLAVICSLTFNSIGFSRGYQQGKVSGKQEQKSDDDAVISEKLIDERQDGYDEGYRIGYEEGKAAGYQLGSDEDILEEFSASLAYTPTPWPTLTPSPTFVPIVLRMKSRGSEVRQFQRRLIELGYLDQNDDDGDYGPKTKKAFEEFQKKNDITPVDGSIVQQDIWNLIMSENAIPMIPISTPTVEVKTEKPTLKPENASSQIDNDGSTQVSPETQKYSEEQNREEPQKMKVVKE